MDKVSIVVPVYNGQAHIKTCIESLIEQSWNCLEIIIVDDGSDDNSLDICKKYESIDERITVIHQKNKGVSSARNAGIKCVTGQYLLFVDADDFLEKNAVECAINCLKNNNADVVVFGWRNFSPVFGNGNDVCFEESVADNSNLILKNLLENYSAYGGGYPWNKLWKIEENKKNLVYFNENLYYFEDLEWVVQMICKNSTVCTCPGILYNYRLNEIGVTRDKSKTEYREIGYHKAIQSIICFFHDNGNYEMEEWFQSKYFPEIINGIVGAQRHKMNKLFEILLPIFYKQWNKQLKLGGLTVKQTIRGIAIYILYYERVKKYEE